MTYKLIAIAFMVLAMVTTKLESDMLKAQKDTYQKIRVMKTFEREHHQTFEYNSLDADQESLLKNYYYVPQEPSTTEL